MTTVARRTVGRVCEALVTSARALARRLRTLSLASLAVLNFLLVSASAQAAMLTVCNKTGEKIFDLDLQEAHLPQEALVANGRCVSWSNVTPGSYYIGYILGGGSSSLLCRRPLKFLKTMTVVISATTMGDCIK